MNIPICIIAFARPHFFERFLTSLSKQIGTRHTYQYFLFLDGPVFDATGNVATDVDLLEKSKTLFSEIVQGGVCFASDVNLGIAANWARAEIFAFDVLNAPVALFFEEDLELGDTYLHIMERLQDVLLDNPFVAGWSAFAHSRDEPSTDKRRRLIPTTPLWGVAQKRSFYAARRSLMGLYYSAIEGRSYRERDPQALHCLFRALGAGCDFDGDPISSSSQDNFRRLATTYCGGVFLSTPGNYARYIGELGEHFREEDFKIAGYATMPLALPDSGAFEVPADEDLGFDVNARLKWYRRFETDHLPLWAATTTPMQDAVLSVARALSDACGASTDFVMNDMHFGGGGDMASFARARLLQKPLAQLLAVFEFLKINLGQGDDDFFHAVCLPKAILHADLDFVLSNSARRVFVMEAETEDHLLGESSVIARFWERIVREHRNAELWLCLPCIDPNRSRAVSLLRALRDKTGSMLGLARNESECKTILSGKDAYLLTKDFVIEKETNLFMIMSPPKPSI